MSIHHEEKRTGIVHLTFDPVALSVGSPGCGGTTGIEESVLAYGASQGSGSCVGYLNKQINRVKVSLTHVRSEVVTRLSL